MSPDGVKIRTCAFPHPIWGYSFVYLPEEGKLGYLKDLLIGRSHGYTFQRVLAESDQIMEIGKELDEEAAIEGGYYAPTRAQPREVHACKAEYESTQASIEKEACKQGAGYLASRGLTPATLRYFRLKNGKDKVIFPLFLLEKRSWFFQTAICYYRDQKKKRLFLEGERLGSCVVFDPLRDNTSTKAFTIQDEDEIVDFPMVRKSVHTLFLFESPVDALSYYQLFAAHLRGKRHVYIATCGNPTAAFLEKMPEIVNTLNPKHVFVLFDNDEGGRRHAARVCQSLKDVRLAGEVVNFCFGESKAQGMELPTFSFMQQARGLKVKDWNDLLLGGYRCRYGCC